MSLWHGRPRCRSESRVKPSPAQLPSARRGELVGDVGGQSFTPLRLRPERDRQPLGRDRRRALRQGLLARIDPLPRRQEVLRRADAAGRRRPCAADPASRAADHRAGQPFLRPRRDQPHRVPPGRLPAPAPKPERPQLRAVPKELGMGLREIADPELRACLELLAARIAATSGPPSLSQEGEAEIPVINRSK